MSWIFDTNSTIYSLIRGKTISELQALYPDVFYTNNNENNAPTRFPSIYIYPIGMMEDNEDMETSEINSAIFTQEVKINFNAEYEIDDCFKVSDIITQAFKELHFSIVRITTPYSNGGLLNVSLRFRRTIAQGDEI